MKRFVTLLSLLTLISLLLTGCGGAGGSSGGGATDNGGTGDNGEEWLSAQVTYYELDGSIDLQITYRYNSHGDICRNEQYHGPGMELVYTSEYTYLDDGRVSSIYHPEGDYTEQYSWDPTGKIAYISSVDANGKETGSKPAMKAYDDQGRLVEEHTGYSQYYYTYTDNQTAVKRYDSAFDETDLTVTKYDKSGRKTEVRRYKAKGFTDCTEDDLRDYILYSYDKKGRHTKHMEYDANGNITTTATYAYEADGHSYRITYADAQGNVTESRLFLYKPAKEVTDQ